MSNTRSRRTAVAIALLSLFGFLARAAETTPKSPDYLRVVRAYADAMIQHGRDTYGPERSPLFAAALDRRTFQLGSREQFGKIEGVRETDRSIGGANPQVDVGLYRILFALTELTREARFAAEAERSLQFFFTHCQSPATGLMAWGEHLYWDFTAERCAGIDRNHEVCGEWPFWDQCYRLAPEACWTFAIGQWDHQIADQTTGDFSRHAQYSKHGPQTGSDFPRYAGQMIINWADAWVRPENARQPRRTDLIAAITCLARRMEENMRDTPTGLLPALRGADYAWPTSNLELARCLWKAAPLIEHEHATLAKRMRELALRQDDAFLKAPHQITSGGGFAVTLHTHTGQPRDRSMNRPYTALWSTGYGYSSHASPANLAHERWEQLRTSHPALAARYLTLIVAAADQYLTAEPAADDLQKPDAFADVINLLLNVHTVTHDARYLRRADHFGRVGCSLFLDDQSPLPKATNRNQHYETITGGPDFMSELLELHRALPAPAATASKR
jgi:hypothetical protein